MLPPTYWVTQVTDRLVFPGPYTTPVWVQEVPFHVCE